MKPLLLKALLIFSILTAVSGCSDGLTTQTTNSSQTTQSETKEKPSTKSMSSNSNSKNLVPAKVIRVVDGDTIKVDYKGKEETVRFLLVDTPETHHPKLGVQPFGPEASQFTHKLLDGKRIQLELAIGGGRDKYGRMLAYIYVNGKSVEEELLKNGLARVAYIYPPNTKYVDEYRAIQETAQKNAVGIWSIEDYATNDGFHPEVMKTHKVSDEKEGSSKKALTSKGSFKPDSNGDCNGEIKGNESSSGAKIYHIPSGSYYKVTKAEQCFRTEATAEDAGFRASQR